MPSDVARRGSGTDDAPRTPARITSTADGAEAGVAADHSAMVCRPRRRPAVHEGPPASGASEPSHTFAIVRCQTRSNVIVRLTRVRRAPRAPARAGSRAGRRAGPLPEPRLRRQVDVDEVQLVGLRVVASPASIDGRLFSRVITHVSPSSRGSAPMPTPLLAPSPCRTRRRTQRR